jgi:hypothetical protein
MIYHKDGFLFVPSSRGFKKYDAFLENGNYIGSFGDKRYQHYRDSISNYYKHLNHYDEKRRNRYFKRHPHNYPVGSPDWFSKRYFWT